MKKTVSFLTVLIYERRGKMKKLVKKVPKKKQLVSFYAKCENTNNCNGKMILSIVFLAIRFSKELIFMYKSVFYNNCVSWGIIDEKVFVFNEESKDIYVFTGMTKDIWLIVNYENHLQKIINKINDNKIDDLSEKIIDLIDHLVSKNLLKYKIEEQY